MFVKCLDLKPERLQEVVDRRLSPYIELVEGSNFGPREDDQQQQQQGVGGDDVAVQAAAAALAAAEAALLAETDGESSLAQLAFASQVAAVNADAAAAAAGNGGAAAAAAGGGGEMAMGNANIALGLGANAPGAAAAVAAVPLGNSEVMDVIEGAANAGGVQPPGVQAGVTAAVDVGGGTTDAMMVPVAVNQQVLHAARAAAKARAARLLRHRKLRAVVAAAAEVGVVVKMLPAVEWQKWYHELLA
jgi:hypothetical protein